MSKCQLTEWCRGNGHGCNYQEQKTCSFYCSGAPDRIVERNRKHIEHIINESRQLCPVCGEPVGTLYFMGIEPEFFVCKKCNTAINPETMKPVARVIM